MNDKSEIIDFVEKPQEFVSDLAMIGIYYFKDGARLHRELQYLIDNAVIKSGEYQLPDALRRMTESGYVFKPGEVSEWLDCGNKEVTVHTNQRVLEYDLAKEIEMIHSSAKIINSTIIPPCYVGAGAVIENSVVGPHVSLGKGSKIKNSVISNTNIQLDTHIENSVISNSMIGSKVVYKGSIQDLSIGDFSTLNA
jgi:glucose-1-phosphate thymidylyltransferase